CRQLDRPLVCRGSRLASETGGRNVMRLRSITLAGMLAGAIVFIPLAAAHAATKPIERFSAIDVDMGSFRARTHVSRLDIAIERWSTDAEQANLLAALKEKGTDGLLSALHKSDEIGYVSTPGRLGLRLHFAYQYVQADGTRRLLIATD